MAGRPAKNKMWNAAMLEAQKAPAERPVTVVNGHRSGIGQGQGAVARYPTVGALEDAIDAYFELQKENGDHPTIPGLAIHLGFRDKSWMYRYMNKGDDYGDAVLLAKTRIEDYKNQMLLKLEKGVSAQGIIMDLKNMHEWTDKREEVQKQEIGDTLAQLIISLQGKVLRPSISNDQAIDADFEEIKKLPPDLEGLI